MVSTASREIRCSDLNNIQLQVNWWVQNSHISAYRLSFTSKVLLFLFVLGLTESQQTAQTPFVPLNTAVCLLSHSILCKWEEHHGKRTCHISIISSLCVHAVGHVPHLCISLCSYQGWKITIIPKEFNTSLGREVRERASLILAQAVRKYMEMIQDSLLDHLHLTFKQILLQFTERN